MEMDNQITMPRFMRSSIIALDALKKLQSIDPAATSFGTATFAKRWAKHMKKFNMRLSTIMPAIMSPNTDEASRQRLVDEAEVLLSTLEQLKNVADAEFDLSKQYPGNLPRPIENALAFLITCIRGNPDKKFSYPFIYGFELGSVFTLKYGNIWHCVPSVTGQDNS